MTLRYKLRTLLLLLATLPPLLAIAWVKWLEYREFLAEQHRREMVQRAVPVTGPAILPPYSPPDGAKLRDGFTLDAF